LCRFGGAGQTGERPNGYFPLVRTLLKPSTDTVGFQYGLERFSHLDSMV
jgi:hypothetical protein